MPEGTNHQKGLELYAQRQYGPACIRLGAAIGEGETCERWNDWASAELACGRGVRAEAGYRRALHFEPASRQAAVNLAALLITQGRLQEVIPILAPHASSLTDEEKAGFKNLVMRSEGRCGLGPPRLDPAPLVDAFLAVISLIPNNDPTMSPELSETNRERQFDSRHYVEQCYGILKDLPCEVGQLALARLKERCALDHRLRLVVARHHLAAGDTQTALSLAWEAMEVKPYDLHVQRVLIEAELAATPAESRARHARAGVEEYLAHSFCMEPWRHFLVQSNGDVYLCCCSGWLVPPVGNVHRSSPVEMWNSPTAQAIRASIHDGSFRYCARVHCARIAGRTLPSREAVIKEGIRSIPFVAGVPELEANAHSPAHPRASDLITAFPLVCPEGPKDIMLAHDSTCNLACPQCRSDFHYASKEERERLDKFVQDFLSSGMLKSAETLRVNESGDVFVSKSCRTLLKGLKKETYPNLKLQIITNGQLCNRKSFDDLNLWGRLSFLNISIDAATEQTYRVLRRGGDFNRLLANMEFLNSIRIHEGEKFALLLRFVVSAFNFREMPAFVDLARRFHAHVDFHFLRNHGTFSTAEFKKLNISNPAHPDYAEFLKVLEAEQLRDPCVDWGNLGHLRPRRLIPCTGSGPWPGKS